MKISSKIIQIFSVSIILFVLICSGCIEGDKKSVNEEKASQEIFDIQIPSESTGLNGNIAVRVISPSSGMERFDDGAPVIIFLPGGYEIKGVNTDFPDSADDIIIVSFVFPGGHDSFSNLSSNGVYDYRGENCIKALRDVILFCAGEKFDSDDRSIDEIIPASILHDNIGLIGVSNGGNLPVAVAAEYGNVLKDHLKYIIQWETPVNSQIACRDLGCVILNWTLVVRGNYENPYYEGYHFPFLNVNYSNIRYKEDLGRFQIFHDGNKDDKYTTRKDNRGVQTPDVNKNDVIDIGEDFPLSNYTDGKKYIYSRAVTKNLANNGVFNGIWPQHIANVSETDDFWDLRESIVLYENAVDAIPDIEAMILCSIEDHVQIETSKPHIRLAFEGWKNAGISWVKINPDKPFFVEVDNRLKNRTDLPDTNPNICPTSWFDTETYCYPEAVYDGVTELAAVYEMADRVENK